jgi:hypothetical protein
MKKNIILIFGLLISVYANSQTLCIPDQLGSSTTSNVGIGLDNPSEEVEIFKNSAKQIAIQFGNYNTNYGAGNGFLVGIEQAGNGLVWNRENNFIRFGTNAEERIRILADGKVGIGTQSPSQLLDVEGTGRFNNIHLDVGGSILGVGVGNFYLGEEHEIWCFEGKNFSIGSNTPDDWARFQVSIHDNREGMYIKNLDGSSNSNAIFRVDCASDQENTFRIQRNGNIGIGTNNVADFRLAVKGKIRATEIVVETGWADFVFNKDYKLRNLEEVENFIEENNHLPDIPSEKEVKENGVQVGEMNAKLLQKIEELTLYMIEQNKETKKLIEKVETLESKNAALENEIQKMKSE